MTDFLLILAPARTGSTLLTSLLGSHPDVAMLNEDTRMGIKNIVGKKISANKLCIPNQMELSRRHNWGSRLFCKCGLYFWFRKHGIMNSYFPGGWYSIEDYLNELSPLKLIGTIRTPDDVVSSMIARGGWKKSLAVSHWSRSMLILDELAKRLPERFRVVAYEQLVADPEGGLKRVSKYLDLPYDPVMLSGSTANPYYNDFSDISQKRVGSAAKEGISFSLREEAPEAHAAYQRLKAIADHD